MSRGSQFLLTEPLLGHSPTMTAEGDRSSRSGSLQTRPRGEAPDRTLALELVRVTEAGAMAAGRWGGRGDKDGAGGGDTDTRTGEHGVDARGGRHRRGRERPGADALQRRRGRQRRRPRLRLRRGPGGRYHADE